MQQLDTLPPEYLIGLGGSNDVDGGPRRGDGPVEWFAATGRLDQRLRWDTAGERALATQRSSLDQQHACALPGTGPSGGQSAGAATDDNEVKLMVDARR
jgi:hypothetical protein